MKEIKKYDSVSVGGLGDKPDELMVMFYDDQSGNGVSGIINTENAKHLYEMLGHYLYPSMMKEREQL